MSSSSPGYAAHKRGIVIGHILQYGIIDPLLLVDFDTRENIPPALSETAVKKISCYNCLHFTVFSISVSFPSDMKPRNDMII